MKHWQFFYILLQKNIFHFIPFPGVFWNQWRFQKREICYYESMALLDYFSMLVSNEEEKERMMRVYLASLCFSLFCTASSTVPCGVSLECLSVPPSAVTGITVCSSLPFPCPAARGAFCSAVGFAVGCFVLEDLGFILFSLSYIQLFTYICNRGHKINKRYL